MKKRDLTLTTQVPNNNHPARENRAQGLLTAKQAAERLGVVPDTIWDWCQSKRLRHRKIGRMIRIDPADLEEFERHRTVEPRT